MEKVTIEKRISEENYFKYEFRDTYYKNNLLRLTEEEVQKIIDILKEITTDISEIVVAATRLDITVKVNDYTINLPSSKLKKILSYPYEKIKSELYFLIYVDIKTINIGKRKIVLRDFINAVEKSKRYTEVCNYLGFNPTVATTKQAIKERIEELGLNTEHFEYKYTKSEGYEDAIKFRRKEFNICPINQAYYNSMEQKFADKPQSWGSYKATIGNFFEKIGNKDFATMTVKEIEPYIAGRKMAVMHIRSMMITAVKENINNAVEKVNKEMLVWLI